MTFSLNEVAAMARKAARGAGLSWGMADEASYAARWLCAAGLDGVGLLASVLLAIDSEKALPEIPDIAGAPTDALAPLCPLHAGVALSDGAHIWQEDAASFGPVANPLLLLPFAARIAQKAGKPVTLDIGGVLVVTDGRTAGGDVANVPDQAARVVISLTDESVQTGPQATRATPGAQDWATFRKLAARTYAPATEASRQSGAGAGTSDND